MHTYEAKYKEVLERAKRMFSEKELNYLFPEFKESKESEDKRIRNEILTYIGSKQDIDLNTHNKWCSWLEKQDEQKSIQNEEDEKIRKYLMNYVESAGVGHSLFDSVNTREDILAWLEKQGESTKDEPKFHEGNWVISNDSTHTYQVKEVLRGIYVLQDNDNDKIYNIGIEQADRTGRLWTIQDAKDGDVLYTPEGAGIEGIFLIEGWKQVKWTGKTLFSSIGYRVEDDKIVAGGLGAIWWEGVFNPFYPATKEQRDLLFRKMHEAGYDWDTERKKIEQNPTEWSLPYWKNETAEKLIALAECLEIDGDCLFNGLSGNDYGKFLRVLAIELTKVKPTAWSEEDETMIRYIGNAITCKESAKYLEKKGVDMITAHGWLDSLKPQPKHDWGEEDEEMIECLNNCLDELEGEAGWRYIYVNNKNVELNNVRNWLKSLKPQKRWKPSEEQINALDEVYKTHGANSACRRVLITLLNDLLKLTE